MLSLFAVTAPGLEGIAARELDQILRPGVSTAEETSSSPVEIEAGGVRFEGDAAALYRANLHLRTANRVLVRIGEFHAASFSELRKRAARLNWADFLRPGQPVAIRATSHKSTLYHSGAVAERIAGAIEDALGQPSSVERPGDDDALEPCQLIVVRILKDHCTVSVDSSGELLHRRGYRQALAKAPLRETLAAAMLLASQWDGVSPLIDPFCGSGVIPIEAALLALRIAPGQRRAFAFMKWPQFDDPLWQRLLAELSPTIKRETPLILASDRDAGAIRVAQENAQRAGVVDYIRFDCHAVSAIAPPAQPGWVVTNPPYGLRVSANKDLRNLYAQFGNVLRSKCAGWRVAILCNDMSLLRQTGLSLDTSLAWVNGGVNVRLARGDVSTRQRSAR